jgi:hypothetical protein
MRHYLLGLPLLLCVSNVFAADLNVGTGETYATIDDAVAAATAGDAIIVHAGSYTEDLVLNQSGFQGSPIRIETAGDGDVTISGRIRINGDWWELVGFNMIAMQGADGIQVDGSNNTIQGIDLSGGDRDGIDGTGVGNQVIDCSIHNFDAGMSDAHCIVLNPGAEDWIIRGNQLYDCSGDTIQLYAGGFERTILNTVIEANHMYFTGAIMRTENAIDVKNADGLIIFGNSMHSFPDNKIVVFQKGPIGIDMQCNEMYDGFTGVEFRAEDGGMVENVVFARNLMHDYASYALKFDGTLQGEVYNNTFVDIMNDGLRIEGAGLDGGMVQNNVWLRTGNIDTGNFGADHNAFFDTGNIDIGSGTDVNVDPMLDTEFKIDAGSPLADAGVDVGLLFAGLAPDLGWYETDFESCGTLPGTGGASSSGTGTASGGSGGDSSGGAGATSASGGASASGSDEEGGCGCTTPGSGDNSAHWLWLLGLVPLSRSRRNCRSSQTKP